MTRWEQARELFETAPLWRLLVYVAFLLALTLLVQAVIGQRLGTSSQSSPPPPPIATGGGTYRSVAPPPSPPAQPAAQPPPVTARQTPSPQSASAPRELPRLQPQQRLPAELLPPPNASDTYATVPDTAGGPLRPRIKLGD